MGEYDRNKIRMSIATLLIVISLALQFILYISINSGTDEEVGAATGGSALESLKELAGESYIEELANVRKAEEGADKLAYLVENSVYVMDDEAVEVYVESYITAAESTAQASGISTDKLIIEEWGYESIEAYREEAQQTAVSFIKEHLAVFEYAKDKNVRITENEYKEQLSAYALKFGYATAAEFTYACSPASIANEMLYDKTIEELK